MQIKCLACQKSFVIDETKYPSLPDSFKCPKCGGQIKSTPPQTDEALPKKEDIATMKEEILRELLSYLPIARKDQKNPGEDEDSKPKALICEDEQIFQEVIKSVLERLGYGVEIGDSTVKSVDLVRQNEYALVAVDNHFPDDAEGGIKILSAINSLSPDMRRKMYVAFISADLSTMDTNSAFIYGANVTVAKKDIKSLEKILKQGIAEHDRQYKTFFEVYDEVKRQEIFNQSPK
jgi:CheY-like chemotaxis protein